MTSKYIYIAFKTIITTFKKLPRWHNFPRDNANTRGVTLDSYSEEFTSELFSLLYYH